METSEPFHSGFPLQELPELTESIFFAFHLGIHKMIYINKAFERIWNVTREQATIPFLKDSVYKDDRQAVEERIAALLQGNKDEFEFRIQLQDGTIKWIKLNAYLSNKGGSRIVMGIASDCTDIKGYNETLQKYSSKKNTLLSILSHDLLGPLGNVQLSTSMMAEYPEIKDNETIMSLIDVINRSSNKSVTLIQQLVNNEFLESSEVVIVKERIDIIERIMMMIEEFNQTLPGKKLRFRLQTALDKLFISVDVIKFMQVLHNLSSNALKFTPDDGSITIYVEDQQKDVLIKVQDTGIGIPADMHPYLFDKFTRARRSGINGEPSIGLGMSIIKAIIEWHNGRIWFESAEGAGTTFYISIPKNE